MKKFIWSILIILSLSLSLYSWLGYKINQHAQTTADGTYDTLIILGAKIKPNGVPSLSLKNRLDEAYVYLEKYPHVLVVVTGGQGRDEDQTEASAMYTYLVNKGVDPKRILIEDKSTSTYENLYYTKQLLNEEYLKATIVSNDFHLSRAIFLAKSLQIEVDTIAAATPKVVERKSRFRERLALLKTYIVGK